MSEDNSGSGPRLVVFGGVSPEGTMLGDTQVLATTAASPSWQPLTTSGTPPPTKWHAMANLPAFGVVLFGGQTDSTTLASGTWVFHGNGWSQVGGVLQPPPRTGHAMALDESRNRIVMYGGRDANNVFLTDTWEFDGTSWEQVFPPSSPGGMQAHSMAFQPATNTIVLVTGSSYLGFPIPAWRYDGATVTWTPIPGPPVLIGGLVSGYRVVRLPGSNTVAVVGGLSDGPVPPQKLVGTAWVGLPVLSQHRHSAHLSYDPITDRVYMYGGYSSSLLPAHTTVVWDGASASLMNDDADPDGRTGHVVLEHGQTNTLYLLGGNSSDVSYYGYSPFEMWRRVGGSWHRETPSPSPAHLLGATQDSQRGRIVLLSWDGTWEWDGTAWQQVTTTGPAAPCVGMAYEAHRSRTVLLRGHASSVTETWEWDGSLWTQRLPGQSPPYRSEGAMAYDPSAQVTLLFGGRGGGFPPVDLNDTWKWDGTTWTQIPTPTTPPAGRLMMAYDPARERIVLAGENGTWEWVGNDWLQRTTVGTPPVSGAMGFDSAINQLVAFADSGSTFEYGPISPALSVDFGAGCPGSGAPPTVAANRLAWVNDVARFTVDVAPNPSIGLIGFSNTFWGGIPLPADLTLLGMPNCNLYTSIDWIQLLPQSTWDVAIPRLPGSVGAQFYLQAIVPDAGAGNPLQATISTPLVNVIGEK